MLVSAGVEVPISVCSANPQLGKCEITQGMLQIVEGVMIPSAIKAECRHERRLIEERLLFKIGF